MEPKPLSLERRQEIEHRAWLAGGGDEVEEPQDYWGLRYHQDVADLLQEVERLEEEVRQARGNRQ